MSSPGTRGMSELETRRLREYYSTQLEDPTYRADLLGEQRAAVLVDVGGARCFGRCRLPGGVVIIGSQNGHPTDSMVLARQLVDTAARHRNIEPRLVERKVLYEVSYVFAHELAGRTEQLAMAYRLREMRLSAASNPCGLRAVRSDPRGAMAVIRLQDIITTVGFLRKGGFMLVIGDEE